MSGGNFALRVKEQIEELRDHDVSDKTIARRLAHVLRTDKGSIIRIMRNM